MTTTSLNGPKDYAYYYRDKVELSVFPLKNPEHRVDGNLEKEKTEGVKEGKQPDVPSTDPYFNAMPTDQNMRLWFKIDPNYNLAIALVAVSQAIAFDVDGPNAVKRIETIIPEMSSTLREALLTP